MERASGQVNLGDGFVVKDRFVDVKSCTVTRKGRAVHVEPRVMDLLVYLAERQGQVISRQEIESEVWIDLVVGYDALNQAVLKLRRVLDDAEHPHRIVETVPKRGYRLSAEVAPSAPVADAGMQAQVGTDRGLAESSVPAIRWLALRLSRRHLFIVAAVALLAAGLLLRPGMQPAVRTDKPSLVILPFENLSGNAEQDFLSDVVTEGLTMAIALQQRVSVSHHASLGPTDATYDPAAIAKSLGVRYVVEGSLLGDADNLRLNVRLFDTDTGQYLWADRIDKSAAELQASIDEIGGKLIKLLNAEGGQAEQLPESSADASDEAGLEYRAMLGSSRRIKCMYGHIAAMNGDYQAARDIFEDCIARWNDGSALIGLAHMYETGTGVAQDFTRATQLIKRGADQPDVGGYSSLARYHYGVALVEGKGIAPDASEALRWLRRAAAEGVQDAADYIERRFPEQ